MDDFDTRNLTQVDIKSPGDHASMGLRSSSSVVLTIDGERYLNAGRSSVFYQQVRDVVEEKKELWRHLFPFYNVSGTYTSEPVKFLLSRFGLPF
jgi:hypothetical protein